jgi:type I restriction enzyme S subunit
VLGLLPEDWELMAVSKLGIIKTGPFGTLLKAAEYSNYNGVPVISVGEIREGFLLITDDTPRVCELVTRRLPEYLLRQGDIVFGRKGAVERSAIIDADQSGWFLGSDGLRLRPAEGHISKYLAYQFQSATVQSYLLRHAIGTTMPSLNQRILGSALVPIPSRTIEQEAIAEALSDADALIESLERLLSKKRDLKQAAMQQLLTGKTRLPGFAGEWETKTIGELFDISGGLSASRDDLSAKGVCYLHYGDIHGSEKSYIDVLAEQHEIPRLDVPLAKVSRGSLLRDGDVVFVDASEDVEGTSKHVVISNPKAIPFISGLHTIVAKPKTEHLTQLYSRYCFQTEKVKSQFRFYAVGTKVSGVSKSSIAKIEILVPGHDEQMGIGRALSDIDAELVAIEGKVAKARKLKVSMIQELLTGKTRLV